MGRGRRYSGEQKLNIKKVIAVIIAIAVILMFFIGLANILGENSPFRQRNVATRYFTVYTNEKYGVIDSRGDIVIEPTYEEIIVIPDATRDLFFCTENVNYETGSYETKAINSRGQEQYEKYDSVEPIQNIDAQNVVTYEGEILKVRNGELYGIIDYRGNELLPCQYQSIEPLVGTSKSILIKKDDKVGLMDDTGSIIIEPEYAEITAVNEEYSNGYIVKNEEGKVGLIGYTKEKILDVIYDEIDSVCGNNYYIVTTNGTKQVVRKNGEKVFDVNVDAITNISENGIIVENDRKYGILDLEGNEKLAIQYEDLQYAFSEYYIAKKDGKVGIIRANGEEVCEFKYEKIQYRKDENFFEATEAGKIESDLIDSNFQVRVTGIISEINNEYGYMKIRVGDEYQYYNFRFEQRNIQDILTTNEIYLSRENGKYGYVNKDGVVVVNYIYDDATELNRYGYAAVKKDGLWGCIDHTGKVIVEPTYSFENQLVSDFIGKWHYGEDINANYYTDEE